MKNNPWHLYGANVKATKAIEAAWNAAKKLAPEKTSAERAALAERHVYAVLEKWSKVGATDTEPEWELRSRVREHFGCDGGYL